MMEIPFSGPTAAIQVGRVDGEFIANPTPQQMEKSDMDIIVAGTRNGLLMVEGETKFISEADALAALKFGHQSMMPLLNAQDELREKVGSKSKRAFTPPQIDPEFRMRAEELMKDKVAKALLVKEKQERYAAMESAHAEAKTVLLETMTDKELLATRTKELAMIVEDLKYKAARDMILDKGTRIDGRDVKTVRPIASISTSPILPSRSLNGPSTILTASSTERSMLCFTLSEFMRLNRSSTSF
jgi:polyribonucleotide nucleotidyltransferase